MFWKDPTLRLLSALLVVIFFFGTLVFAQPDGIGGLQAYFLDATKANSTVSVSDETYGPYISEMPRQTELPRVLLTGTGSQIMIGQNCFTHEVPVLMYHHIRSWPKPTDKSDDVTAYELSVDPALFDEQMKYLYDRGYQTILAKDLLEGSVPCNSIVVTIDDGYKDVYTNAFPILKKYGFRATVAIIWNRIDRSDYMTMSDIEELQTSGYEIASHTLTHPGLPFITPDQMVKEVKDSKPQLEKKLGTKIVTFIYPMGQYNNRVLQVAKDAGYSLAMTTKLGLADLAGDMFELKRLRISNTLHKDFSKIFKPEVR